jgi:hypothetical protein
MLSASSMLSRENQSAINRLSALSCQQLGSLRDLAHAWENKYVHRVHDAIRTSVDYFDPQKPEALVMFVTFGGVDLYSSLLQDNPSWLVFPQSPAFGSAHPPRYSEQGGEVLVTMMRVLTELLVCYNEIGWYIYDRHPLLMTRLIAFIRVTPLRESAIMLLEHIVSVIGPVIDLSQFPELVQIIVESTDAGLASLCRLLALLIVPGVMNEQTSVTKGRLEPFPQCLTRMSRIEDVVDRNVKILLDQDAFIERLLKLGGTRANGVRIFQGNRTMTVMIPEGQELPAQVSAASAAVANGGGPNLLNQLQQLFASLQAGNFSAATSQPPPPPQSHHHQDQHHQFPPSSPTSSSSDQEYDEDEAYQDFFAEGTVTLDQLQQQVQAAPAIQPSPAAAGGINSALLGLIASLGAAGASPAAAATTADVTPGLPQQGSTQQQLQQVAESLSQGMPPANSLDSIDFSWLIGHAEAKVRWRLGHFLLHDLIPETPAAAGTNHEWVLWGLNSLGQTAKNSAKAKADTTFVQTLRESSDAFRKSNARIAKSVTQQENQNIVNSQSEVFFVLNSALAASHYTRAWNALTRLNLMANLNPIFDYCFFLDGSQQSINAGGGGSSSSASGGGGASSPSLSQPAAASSSAAATLFEDPLMDPLLLSEEDIAERSKIENDDRHHRHDPDTLRKLELLRIIHEYWNAQDRIEAEKLHASGNPEESAKLAVKLARQLQQGKEDPCTETVACHALESFLRCFGPSMPRIVLQISEILFTHTLIERIYNAPRKCGAKYSVFPQKRMDAFFSVFGEMAKYNEPIMQRLGEYLMKSQADLASDHPELVGEGSLFVGPIARAEFDGLGDAVRRRISQFCGDCNLFIRSIGLTCTPGLTCPINYVWKPTGRHLTEEDLVDSRVHLPLVQRHVESTVTMIGRMFTVRQHSRRFVEALCIAQRQQQDASNKEQSSGSSSFSSSELLLCGSEPGAPMTSSLPQMLELLCNSPHTHTMADRPFPRLFSADDTALLDDGARLPPPGLPADLRERLLGKHTNVNACKALYSFDQIRGDQVCKQLLDNPARLVYGMISSINPEEMENTERLCVVTSSLVLLMHANVRHGESGVMAVLEGLRDIEAQKRVKIQASSSAAAGKNRENRAKKGAAAASDMDRVLLSDTSGALVSPESLRIRINVDPDAAFTKCSGKSKIETNAQRKNAEEKKDARLGGFCDDVFDFGCCKPPSMVESYTDEHSGCIFKNFFRLLCIWLAHYACSQRYVETLFYCTHVPYAEWKQTALFVWKTLPKFFTL